MTNRLQLSADFIHRYLTWLDLAPEVFEIPVGMGLTLKIRLDAKEVRIAGDAFEVPLRAEHLATVTVRFDDVGMADELLWFAVPEVRIGRFRVPAMRLLQRMVNHFLGEGSAVKERDGRYGIDINAQLAENQGLCLSHVEVDDGLIVEFDVLTVEDVVAEAIVDEDETLVEEAPNEDAADDDTTEGEKP